MYILQQKLKNTLYFQLHMNEVPKFDWVLAYKARFNKFKTFCSTQTTFCDQSTIILEISSSKIKLKTILENSKISHKSFTGPGINHKENYHYSDLNGNKSTTYQN